MDPFILDAATEAPQFNSIIKNRVRDFCQNLKQSYGDFMSASAKDRLEAVPNKIVPIAEEFFHNTELRYLAAIKTGIKGWAFRKILDLADNLNIDLSKTKSLSGGVHFKEGGLNLINIPPFNEYIKNLPVEIKSDIETGKVSIDAVTNYFVINKILIPSFHESFHGIQDDSLTHLIRETSANYYTLKYLGIEPTDGYFKLHKDYYENLLEQFGNDLHKLVFGSLPDESRKTEILRTAMKLETPELKKTLF